MIISPRDPVVDTGSRSRIELLQDRKAAKTAEAAKWAGAVSPRTVQMNVYHADAVTAATAYMQRLLGGTATADDARRSGMPLDRDAAPATGTRYSSAKEAMCTTYYTSLNSKKIDPKRRVPEAHPTWEHSEASTQPAFVSPATPRPALPAKKRKAVPLAPTIGRDAIVENTPNPPHFPMHRMYIRRPEVTTLDSYDVPVYSSFSGDKAFHPEMDDALRSQRERRWRRRREELRKLKEREAHHREVALEFAHTMQRVRDLKADARAAQAFVTIMPDDAMPPADTRGVATAEMIDMGSKPMTPYDPHRLMQATKTPRSAVPSRPADAVSRAAMTVAATTEPDSAPSNTDVTNAANTNLLAGKLHHHADVLNAAMAVTVGFGPSATARPTSASLTRKSPPRRLMSPGALAAAQALEFKVVPRPPSAHGGEEAPAVPQAQTARVSATTPSGPLAVTSAGMDLFALTRVHSSTSYGPTPTPPPPARSAAAVRPWSAQNARAANRPTSAQPLARCVSVGPPPAFTPVVTVAANRRPHSARAPGSSSGASAIVADGPV